MHHGGTHDHHRRAVGSTFAASRARQGHRPGPLRRGVPARRARVRLARPGNDREGPNHRHRRRRVTRWPGVLAVLTHENTPRLAEASDGDLQVLLQDDRVRYRGQVVALVVATSLETARAAAGALTVSYVSEPHDVLSPRTIPRCTSRRRSTRIRDRHLGRRRRRGTRDGPGRGGPHVPNTRRAQQPDGAARVHRPLGRWAPDALRLEPGRGHGSPGARCLVRRAGAAIRVVCRTRRRRLRIQGNPRAERRAGRAGGARAVGRRYA